MERGANARFISSTEAMDIEDYPMADDESVLASTELNGDSLPGTVDPSKLGVPGSSHLNNDPLPFHSPSKAPHPFQLNPQPEVVKGSSNSPNDTNMSSPEPLRRARPEVRVAPKPRAAVLPYASGRTGLVYDSRMRFHAELPNMSISADDGHPEDPRRIHAIFEEIQQAGLVASSNTFEAEQTGDHCWRIAIRSATRPEILLIHTEEHYNLVKSFQCKSKILKCYRHD
jgi:histone deacetylase 6